MTPGKGSSFIEDRWMDGWMDKEHTMDSYKSTSALHMCLQNSLKRDTVKATFIIKSPKEQINYH